MTLRKAAPRRSDTANTRTKSKSVPKLDRDVFTSLVSGGTRLANGANSQSEEGINKVIVELLEERGKSHTVAVPGFMDVVKPRYISHIFSHHRCALSKSIIGILAEFGDKVVGYYMVLEGTGTLTEQFYVNGTPNERNETKVIATADMVFDEHARRIVTESFQVLPQIQAEEEVDYVYPFCVIPTSVTPADKHILSNYVDNAIDAIDSIIRENIIDDNGGATVLTLDDYMAHSTPRLSLDFNPDHTAVNAQGSPLRSDARARLRIEVGNRDRNEGRSRGRETTINETAQDLAEVSVFCDVNFFKDGLGEHDERFFLPIINVTEANTGASNPDLRQNAHLIWTISQLSLNGRWKQMLDPVKLLESNRDLNALLNDVTEIFDFNGNIIEMDGIDLNSSADDAELFLDMAFEDAPIIQFRIPRGDATTWAYNPLLAAVTDTDINNLLIEAIDEVCNGKLNARLIKDGNEDIFLFEADTDIVHVGHYINSNGEQRDLAEIDNLRVSTWAAGTADDIAVREEWESTFLNDVDSNLDIGTRLNRRLDIIAEVVGGMGNVHVSGYADVITLNPAAAFAIVDAFTDAGFRPKSPESARVRALSRGNRHLRNIVRENRDAYASRDSRNAPRRRRSGGPRRVSR